MVGTNTRECVRVCLWVARDTGDTTDGVGEWGGHRRSKGRHTSRTIRKLRSIFD